MVLVGYDSTFALYVCSHRSNLNIYSYTTFTLVYLINHLSSSFARTITKKGYRRVRLDFIFFSLLDTLLSIHLTSNSNSSIIPWSNIYTNTTRQSNTRVHVEGVCLTSTFIISSFNRGQIINHPM